LTAQRLFIAVAQQKCLFEISKRIRRFQQKRLSYNLEKKRITKIVSVIFKKVLKIESFGN